MRSSWFRTAVLAAGAGLIAACTASVGGQASVNGQSAIAPQPGSVAIAAGATVSSATVSSATVSSPTVQTHTPSSSSPSSSSSTVVRTGVLPTPDGSVGSTGIGDAYYPDSGNGGYDVAQYDISLSYDPSSNHLKATTTVTGKVTETTKLGRFDLDLQQTMEVSAVTVNGQAAAFEHQGAELVINPETGLAPGAALTVVVTYSGQPAQIPGGAANLGDGGWYRTPSGGAVAIGEPFSGSAWYPVNEHPSDPATYRVTATVPQKWSVISNGIASTTGLPTVPAGQHVFRWTQSEAIPSYAQTIYIDRFTTVTDRTVDGKPIVSVFAPGPDVAELTDLAKNTSKILQVLSNHFGPYPFDAAGGIYTEQQLTFALETATRPVYPDPIDLDTIVHELTHQWFGDHVVVKRWSDICLNECFASYGPWLWHQDVDGADLDAEWVDEMSTAVTDPTFWASPLVDMGAGNEFTSVYTRGPLAIHALRKQMGEKNFAALLKGWPATYGGKEASYDDLVAYVNKISGQNLTAFMAAWFRGTTAPPAQYLHPGGIGQ